MSYIDLLISTCTIRRFAEGVADTYGVLAKTWSDHLLLQACRLMDMKGREVKIGAEVVVAEFMLFLGDVDVTERDRVLLDGFTYEVVMVNVKQNGVGLHHKECLMVRIR
ncbi:hypothetical protein LCGC14_1697900 [marine sediment metagenome]|uniref:Phage head-tail adaptor n=1 Tax=marine sediment metagenome TaxID=412755 RepID=A0A0F9HIM7_9ZZZZ